MNTLYGIKNCDTVRKARQWLEHRAIDYRFHDFRSDGLTEAVLRHWLESTAWKTLLNQRSTGWRQLSDEQKSDLDENKVVTLLLDHPTLIKRPVLDTGAEILVGFKADQYQTLFQS